MLFVTLCLEIFHCPYHLVIPKSDLYFTFLSTVSPFYTKEGGGGGVEPTLLSKCFSSLTLDTYMFSKRNFRCPNRDNDWKDVMIKFRT